LVLPPQEGARDERFHAGSFASDNQRLLLIACKGKDVFGYEVHKELKLLFKLTCPDQVFQVALNPSGSTAAVALDHGSIALVDVNAGKITQRLPAQNWRVIGALSFSPDGNAL